MKDNNLFKIMKFILNNNDEEEIIKAFDGKEFSTENLPTDLDNFIVETDKEFKLKELPLKRIREYIGLTKQRERNLKIKLFKFINENGETVFNKKDLKNKLYFKKVDIRHLTNKFFEKVDQGYEINDELIERFQNYKNKKDEINNFDEKKEIYIDLFEELKNSIHDVNSDENLEDTFSQLVDLASNLHWQYMPYYPEQMLINRRVIPEENPKEYYNQFHALEDLYNHINGDIYSWKDSGGDLNLEEELKFNVYTVRWGYEDKYTIIRTIYGWEVRYNTISGYSLKNGVGSIFNNLEHDLVFYPTEGVKHAFEILWRQADRTEMNVEILQEKLQEIADWISDVERNMRREQPSWCHYY